MPSRNGQVPELTISDECKWCGEDQPEWSPDAKCWIHRSPSLDRRCTRKILGPCGEMPTDLEPETGRIACSIPTPTGEERESAQEREEFEKAVIQHLGDDRFVLRNTQQPDKYDAYLVDHLWWAWQAASRRIAALQKRADTLNAMYWAKVKEVEAIQQRFDSLIERVNAASSMEEIAAILNDYEAENAELRKRMGKK